MKKIIFATCFLLASISIQAQQKWTLRQCIDYAIENNIEIKKKEIDVKANEVDVNTAKMSRLPNLNAGSSYNFRFGQVVDETTNTKISTNASVGSLYVESSTPLFTGFKITNQIEKNKLDLLSSIESLKKAKDNLELQVTTYYLEALFKKEILEAYKDQNELTQKQVEKTSLMVEAGKIPLSQLYDIKAQQAKDELNVTTAANALNLAILDLSQALNLNEMNFSIVEPNLNNVIENNIASILPPDDIYQTALVVKSHVKELEYYVESGKKTIKIAKADYYPTLNFNMGYNTSTQRRYLSDNPTFARQFRDNRSEYFGFSLSIPIFNRFAVRNNVKLARLEVDSRTLDLDNVKLALYKEIQQAYQSATAAQAKYSSTEKAYFAANESYKYAEERYAAGKSTVFELNESQTKMLTSKSEQIQAKYDFLFRAKILDFYRGAEIDIK